MTKKDGQMVKRSEAEANVRGLMEKMKPQFEMALPRALNADRFLRIAITQVMTTPKLLECSQRSLLGAVMEAAQLGLEPGILGQCWLVPYGQTAQLIVGYKGLVELTRRSGQISVIYTQVVRPADQFSFSYGDDPKLTHVPSSDPRSAEEPISGAYAVARLKDGGKQFEFLWKHQIDKIRDRSAASKSGPWVTDYEEMARKTVLKRLCKMLPMTPEGQRAVAQDDRAEIGLPQELPTVELPGDSEPVRSALEVAADQLEAKEDEEVIVT